MLRAVKFILILSLIQINKNDKTRIFLTLFFGKFRLTERRTLTAVINFNNPEMMDFFEVTPNIGFIFDFPVLAWFR